ncbi:LytR C-terminal domain-containing protein [Aeromicrobium sp.]|uniref:LytR C-terminal domain-containing protein n=1 Tax=Aeromicrobium sp. TaxID=1871063 RepID=UPI001995C151|nr:LytR C-terminal domain-containing protein [Aeromicrobium sp.]MBC7631978.1 LytR C-terminal domain-containing protein [Aeromicrobium sp.]
MDHRRTPSRKAFVPPGWFIVLTLLVIIGSTGWLGWAFVDGADKTLVSATPAPSVAASPTPTAPSSTPTPTPEKTTPQPQKTKAPQKTRAPEKTKAPEVQRDASVSVLNNTRNPGLAGSFAARVRQTGWVVASVGNWRGSVPGNTVYYPAGFQDRASLLGSDVGIGRILPGVTPMRMDRLTIILAGPQ